LRGLGTILDARAGARLFQPNIHRFVDFLVGLRLAGGFAGDAEPELDEAQDSELPQHFRFKIGLGDAILRKRMQLFLVRFKPLLADLLQQGFGVGG
jgi:hypothetical protein